jgi:hypothetical protein
MVIQTQPLARFRHRRQPSRLSMLAVGFVVKDGGFGNPAVSAFS